MRIKVALGLYLLFFASLGFGQIETNREARGGRFSRGEGSNPTFQSFVVPFEGQKGVALDPMGVNTAKFPNGTPWFITFIQNLSTGTPPRYHFGYDGVAANYNLQFQNPIVAFGSDAGGTPLYYNQPYSFAVGGGDLPENADYTFAYAIIITAIRKSDLQYEAPISYLIPRRFTPSDASRWDSYVKNGYVWPTPEFPAEDYHGFKTTIELLPGGVGGPAFGSDAQSYILKHVAGPGSENYYFLVGIQGYYATTVNGQTSYLSIAANLVNGQFQPASSRLYVLNFDEHPAWRSVRLQIPHFEGEPLPSSYLGKSLEELQNLSPAPSQTPTLAPSACLTLDQSPELQSHPILNKFVQDMANDPMGLANYVCNEIKLTDPISYNENGLVSDKSINPGGVNRNALVTFLEGRGSPAEQCALLVYMLRKANVPAVYLYPEQNKLKMLDAQLSKMLQFQIKGIVNNKGEKVGPYDPAEPTMIPVNYPWVAAYVNVDGTNQWVHLFPWIKDIDMQEGLNLYDQLPEGYNNGYRWLEKYLNKDSGIVPDNISVFQQSNASNGMLAIEAEQYHNLTDQGGHTWKRVTTTGYSGNGAVQSTPNSGSSVNSGYTTASPRLDYKINFTKSGTHYIWVKGIWPNLSDNSIHIGLDGLTQTSAESITRTVTSSSYAWTRDRDILAGGGIATIDIPSAGIHTLNVYMREDGCTLDRIILTKDSSFNPNSTNAANSARNSIADDTPESLFPKFVEAKLKENHPGVSLDDIGMKVLQRKNYYSRWGDFPKPFKVEGAASTVESLKLMPNIFDTLIVKIYSEQNPGKQITTGEQRVVDLLNRKFLIRHTKNGSNHDLTLTLSPFRPGITGTGSFGTSDPDLLKKQVLPLTGLGSSDSTLAVEFTHKRHRNFTGTVPDGRWNTYLGLNYSLEAIHTAHLAKGDLSAICLSAGSVSKKMLDVHAQEFWQFERDADANQGNPGYTPDPDIYQGTPAYLMGMSYYERCDRFRERLSQWHKRHVVSSISLGLATLQAYRENGVMPNGDIKLAQPQVDMFTQEVAFVGNGSFRPDLGNEALPASDDFACIWNANNSAQEHQVMRTFFKQEDAVSTVRLLHMAHDDPVAYSPGIISLTKNNYLSYDSQFAGYDAPLWNATKAAFAGEGGYFTRAYITPKPVIGALGGFKGMGVFIQGVDVFTSRIGNLNGGWGDYFLSFDFFDPSNSFNLSLSFNPGQDLFAMDLFSPSAASPFLFGNQTQYQNFDNTYSQISSNSLLFGNTSLDWMNYSSSTLGLGLPSNPTGSQLAINIQQTQNGGFFGSALQYFQNGYEFVFDPVSVVTGEFYHDEVDLKLDGPMPLVIRRNYSSRALVDGNFGWGWRMSCIPYLTLNSDQSLVFAAEMDGSVVAYRRQTGNTNLYVPSTADNPRISNPNAGQTGTSRNLLESRILKSTSGSDTLYTLTAADGSIRHFKVRSFPTSGTHGLTRQRPYLEKWEDNRGNYYTFTFDPDSASQSYGQLVRVESSNGNFVGFYYDAFGHITEAYSGDGRRVYYRYDEFGDLIEITHPDGATCQYEYGRETQVINEVSQIASTHLVEKETKPDGRILENDYDASRRVTEQRATVGDDLVPVRNATFIYSTTESASGDIDGHTLVLDAYNRTTRYDMADGLITQVTDPNTNVVTQHWFTPADSALPGYYPRSLKQTVDKRGLTTDYQYDARGNLTETKLVSGDVNGDGVSNSSDVATTAIQYHPTLNIPERITDPMLNKTVYSYTDGNYPYLPTRIEKFAANNTSISTTVNTFTAQGGPAAPFAKGLLESITRAQGTADEAVATMGYDNRGFMTTLTRPSGAGGPTEVLHFKTNTRGELFEKKDAANRKWTYFHDNMGRPTGEEVRDENNQLLSWNYQYYNLNGEPEWVDGPRFGPEDYIWNKYDGGGRRTEVMVWRSKAKDDGTGVDTPSGDEYFATTFKKYNLFGDLLETTDPYRNTTVMTYDGIGRMRTRTLHQGGSTGSIVSSELIEYEPGDQISVYTNPLGGVTRKFYTATGQLRRQENPDNTVLLWEYDLSGRLVKETLANNSYWITAYNDAALTVTRTLHNSGGATIATESKTLDHRGNVKSQTDVEQNTFVTEYDDLDRATVTTGPAGGPNSTLQTTTRIYDASGKVLIVRNGLTEETETTFDALQRPLTIKVKNSGGAVVRQTSTSYSPDHHSVTRTDGTGAGAVTTTTYTDTEGREVLVNNGANEKTFIGYLLSPRMRVVKDSLNRTTAEMLDPRGLTLSRALPDGATTSFYYDDAGNLEERHMPGGIIHYQTFDNASRILTERLESGSETSRSFAYTYYPSGDSVGRLNTATDPRGIVQTYAYDDFQRIYQVTASNTDGLPGVNRTFLYDKRGLPKQIDQSYSDAAFGPPTSVVRGYDGYGQLTDETVSLDGNTVRTFSQHWDAAGRRSQLLTSDSSLPTPFLAFTHQADGRLTQTSANGQNYAFAYGDNGLLSSRTNPFRTLTLTQRDGAGRLKAQSQTVAATTPLSESLNWRSDGTVDDYTANRSGSGTFNETRDYDYNSRGQLTLESFAPASAQSASLNYTFDGGTAGIGVRTRAQISGGFNLESTTVNSLARVTVEETNSGKRAFTATGNAEGAATVEAWMDGQKIDNLVFGGWQGNGDWSAALELPPGQHTLTGTAHHPSGQYDPSSSSTFTVAGTSLTIASDYDAQGFTTQRTYGGKTQTLTWDSLGRLIKVTERDASNNGYDWSAIFDGLGRRLQTTHVPVVANVPNTIQTTTINQWFDPQVEFLELGVSVNGVKSWKVLGPDLNGVYGGAQGIGGLEAVLPESGAAKGVLNDFFGNNVASVQGGVTTWNITRVGGYGPLPGFYSRPLSSSIGVAEAAVWKGKAIDPTGFYYWGARPYDPQSGRFQSPDPAGHAVSMDLYSYVHDPVKGWDSDGRITSGFASGLTNQSISLDSPNSGAFDLGFSLGGMVNGYYGGLGQGGSQLVLGNYSNQPQTWDSIAGQIGVGFSPAGVLADVRDWSQAGLSLASGEGSFGGFGLATVMLIPGASEAGKLFKGAGTIVDISKARVFWSGGDAALQAAESFALRNGATTLELSNLSLKMTSDSMLGAGADWLTVVRPTIWEPASKSFAEGASGVVNVFQNAEGVSIGSVWRQVEYDALLKNPNVTEIKYHVVMPDGSVIPVP